MGSRVDTNLALCRLFGIEPGDATGFDLCVRAADMPRLTVHRFVRSFRQDTSETFAVVRRKAPRTIDEMADDALARIAAQVAARTDLLHAQIAADFSEARHRAGGS